MTPRPLLSVLTTFALAATSCLVGTQVAAAAPDPGSPGGAGGPVVSGEGLSRAKLSSSVLDVEGTITAFVQLDAPSGLDVVEDGGSPAQVRAATEQVEELAAYVVPDRVTARSATPAPRRVSTLSNVVSGTIVTGDAATIRGLAESEDVVSIRRVTPKTPDNRNTDVLTRALEVWQSTGQTGEGIRVGVIDTGLDYTHASFGGAGTVEAYDAAYGEDGTQPVPEGSYDPEKFLGGYDFAGPLYDPSADPIPGTSPIPVPDENPIDSLYTSDNSGHGTHVAGTAVGYGVTADGTTFSGDYAELTDLSDWTVGPGSAPEAGVYALKVFGDLGGSTELTSVALDWAADPDGDGDFNDHLDVVNLSLGASGAPVDDPDTVVVNRLADLGVLSVFSAGNSGDITDIGGSPGSAASGLTVANSVGSPLDLDGVEVTVGADPSLDGVYAAQNSVSYAGTEDVTAPVAYLGDEVDGCTSLAPYAEELAGKIAYLWWDDDDSSRLCGSGARFNAAQAAGAVGVLLGTENTIFSAGIAGNATIPGAQLTAASTDALLAAIQTGTVTAHIGPSLAGTVQDASAGDALNPGSSRGAHGSLGILKPDVAAPGTSIQSAASGTGNEAHTLSGTSMAAPHVAGIAALVRATNPGWTPAQVKASVMNTATHDLFTGPNRTGEVYGPERVGSGRVDAVDAVANGVLAYSSESPEQVSVVFGVVDVGAQTVVEKKTVTVTNTTNRAVRYATSFDASTTAGGATVTTSPASLTVPAGQSRLVTVTLTADPSTLERELDPTSEAVQGGVPREYVATVSGRLVLTSEGSTLRVPVHAAPRLASELTAQPVTFADPATLTAELELTGRGVASGGWFSLAAPLVLGATSPQLEDDPRVETSPSAVAAGDLRYVGWASTAPQRAALGESAEDGYLGIGIATQGEWATLGRYTLPVIDLDIDGDGAWDTQTVVQKLDPASDVTVQATFDYVTDELLDVQPVNGVFGDVETTVFDNNVAVVPLSLADVGITPGTTPTVRVWTASEYAADPSEVVDEAEPFTVDPFTPPFWFSTGTPDTLWFLAGPDAPITVHRTEAAKAGESQLLVLHSRNTTTTNRAQVVDVTVPEATPTTTALKVSGSARAGAELTLTATVTPAEATGTVRFLDGDTEVAAVPVAAGTATAKVRLGAGTHALSAVFTPDGAAYAASTSEVVSTKVAKSGSTLGLTLSKASGTPGQAVSATVTVTGRTAAPTGTVELRERGTVLGTGTLVTDGLKGTVTIALPTDLPLGTHQITAVYTGSADVESSSTQRSYRVKPARRS